MKKALYTLSLISTLGLSGCATVFMGVHQPIDVRSNVQGATIKVDGKAVGQTPMVVPVRRDNNHSITVEKEGYKPFEYSIRKEKSQASLFNWTFLVAGTITTLATASDSYFDSNNHLVESSYNWIPVIVGGVASLAGLLVDKINDASNKFNEDKIQADIVKIPGKIEAETSIPFVCNNVVFKIQPGTKLGTVTINGNKDSDIKWEHTLNIGSTELTEQVNNDLQTLGYQTMLNEGGKKLKMAKAPKMILTGTVEEIKHNVVSKSYEISRELVYGKGYLVTSKHDYRTETKLKVNWELRNYKNKQLVYQETVSGNTLKKGEEDGKKVLVDAFQNSLYTLLNNGKIQEHLIRKAGAPQKEISESIMLNKPEAFKEGNINGYLPEIMKSVMTISTGQGHGSGFIISPDGYVITNFHVVEGFDSVKVWFDEGDTLTARVIEINENRDLALLKVNGKDFKALSLNDTDLAPVGSEVYAIGTPADINLGQTISRGIISGKRKIEDKLYLQTDVSVSLGNSGGPLVNNQGIVIGVVSNKMISAGVEGIAFAIPSNEVFGALNLKYKVSNTMK